MEKLRARRNTLPIIMHLLVWLVLIILPQIIISRYSGNNNFIAWGFYINASIIGVIFYINYFWLVPKFYMNNKKALFLLLAIVVVICFYFILDYSNHLYHRPDRDRRIVEEIQEETRESRFQRPPFKLMQIYGYSLLSIVIVGFSIGLRAIEQYTASEKRQKELEKEKLNSELAFLKNQVSPHFFFNTLNNIYSMVAINTDDAQASILKLSKLMRYLLYESEHGVTKLSDEIEFMRNYIDLMQLRVSQKVDIQIDLPSKQNDLKIPPLLFIPFIENAFKHGISYREKSFIKVKMKTSDNKVFFSCENSVAKEKAEKRDENHSGIGLENVKKRLNLLFAGKYDLNIDSTPEIFSVKLEIDTAK
ncbi:sensor histidine kinase [Draconibacterium halophilum]|uniref:GHKL domain-containing protein n=1 Tax=Draconibacterium halophilum TaxID=2706887 RepID=A0A6C0RC82_9BACT|nr:histidine kinase [Draconibacterium halophilum]QIA07677.1 GHKL domain-containing protein [Draconibacterium halophilum]